jgi:biotin carboxylase
MDDPSKPKRLLLLVPTTSYRIGDFLDAAERLGIDAAVGSDQAQVLEPFSDGRTTTVEFGDLNRGLSQIVAYNARYPLAAIIGVDDETTLLAAMAAEELGLPRNSPDSVNATTNKHLFRLRLANSGLLTPRFQLLQTSDDPAHAAKGSFYPAVLKPTTLSASRGVIRADDPERFVAAFQRIRTILKDTAIKGDARHQILVEEYVPGAEVALEGLLDGGWLTVLALFDKPDPLEGPYFEETIYVTPSRLPPSVQDNIAEVTRRAVEVLGLREGSVHAELRINERGVWLIELAVRSIGGLCSRALDFGVGGRLEDIILRHALGLPVSAAGPARPATGVMMVPIPCAGTLTGIDGVESARRTEGVEEVTMSIPLGSNLVPVPEGNRYLGFIFASGPTPDAVEAALREAHSLLTFNIVPETPLES